MKWGALFLVMSSPLLALAAEDSAGVQPYLDRGDFRRGRQALEARLETSPDNDELRFGLGVVQIVASIERLAQTLHAYGVKQPDHLPLKLPLHENKAPNPIRVLDFFRMMDDFRRELLDADRTLTAIKNEQVHLQINWSTVHLDLDGDGQAGDSFDEVLTKIVRVRPAILKENPSLRVNFDRGDVAWLRAYCHLLAAIVDGSLSCLDADRFEIWADQVFAKPIPAFQGTFQERINRSLELTSKKAIPEPLRLGRMRRHLVRVCDLNQETWKYIRAETDDDQEWLPNPRQTGALRLPVRDQIITDWLAMISELRLLLEGERVLPNWFDADASKHPGKGINLKLLLDEPPEIIRIPDQFPEKYVTAGKEANIRVFFILLQMFADPSLAGYPVWFN